jgi:hypothetical protein
MSSRDLRSTASGPLPAANHEALPSAAGAVASLLGALEAMTTLCEWFAQREAGRPTTNSEAAMFARCSNACAQLEAAFDLSSQEGA